MEPVGACGRFWTPVDAFGRLGGALGACGRLWTLVGACGRLSTPLGTAGRLWAFLDASGCIGTRFGRLRVPVEPLGSLWGASGEPLGSLERQFRVGLAPIQG